MAILKRKSKGVRWGHIFELKGIKVPTSAHVPVSFERAPRRIRQLASWRFLHKKRVHNTIRGYARSGGYKPSSDIPLVRGKVSKVNLCRKFSGRK